MDKQFSKASRAELINRYRLEYHKAGKKRKGEILDAVLGITGMNRTYAARVLGKAKTGIRPPRRNKPSRYRRVLPFLRMLWEASNHDCGKRLQAILPLYLSLMTRHGSLPPLRDEDIHLLLSISASSIDRLLAPERKARLLTGLSTTRPGSMVKRDVPLRTFADWDDTRSGFFEADLVAFCGDNARGDFVFTMTMTDIASGWMALGAMLGRSRLACTGILDEASKRIPFPMLGFDSDNDSVFINNHMLDYCTRRGLVFTRSRPNHSNDGCHVEQKNWDVVRKMLGYARLDTQEQLLLLREILLLVETYHNFLQPSFKLLEKHRIGAKLYRKHSPPRTPLQYILDSAEVTEEKKAELRTRLETLDPADLLYRIQTGVEKLIRMR
jgi:hypothetical protein